MRIGILGSGLMGSRLGTIGNHKAAKRTAAKLIRDVGFHPVDLGKLPAARYIEPFSLLLAEIAFNGSAGPQLTYRFESLA